VAENKVQITIEAIDKAKEALTNLADGLKGIQDQTRGVAKESTALGGILSSLKENWAALSIGINQALELLNKALYIPRKMTEWGEMGAQIMRTEQAFKAVAEASGYSSDKILADLVKASKGTMDASDIMQRAGRLMQEGIDPSKLVEMMKLLQRQAPLTGDTMQEAWDKIGSAMTTGNLRMAKQYVGYVDLQKELSRYAESLGTTADRLSEHGRQVATFDITLSKMRATTQGLAADTNTYSESIQKSNAQIKESWDTIKKSFVPEAERAVSIWAKVMDLIAKVLSSEMVTSKKYYERQAALKGGYGPPMEAGLGFGPVGKPPEPLTAAPTLEQEMELQSFRLSTRAKILEAIGREREALEARQAAEIAGEKDVEKQVEMDRRHRAEMEKFDFDKRIYFTKTAMQEEAKGSDDMLERLADRRQVEEDIQEMDKNYYAWLEKASGEPAKRFQAAAEATANWRSQFPTLQESMSTTIFKIKAMADTYQQLFQSTGKYAREWVYYREELLDQEIEDLKATLDEELAATINWEEFRAERIKRIRIEGGLLGLGESWKAGLKDQEVAWSNTSANMVTMAKDSAEAMRSSMEEGFFDIMTLRFERLDQIAANFLDGLARAFARWASTEIGAGLLGYLGGFGGMSEGAAIAAYRPTIPYHEGSHGIITIVPKFHQGSDEFLALLQTGERVLSRKEVAAGAGSPQINVNIQNYTGAQVTARETGNGRGSRDLTILISEVTGSEARRYGSPLNRGIRQIGGMNPLISR
jgi:hypothetical protein